jgi:hypothetical protein
MLIKKSKKIKKKSNLQKKKEVEGPSLGIKQYFAYK